MSRLSRLECGKEIKLPSLEKSRRDSQIAENSLELNLPLTMATLLRNPGNDRTMVKTIEIGQPAAKPLRFEWKVQRLNGNRSALTGLRYSLSLEETREG